MFIKTPGCIHVLLCMVQGFNGKRNISENKYTSQEIAFKMGFKEPSNFIRFFKKFTGVTPNQFQEEMKKEPSVRD